MNFPSPPILLVENRTPWGDTETVFSRETLRPLGYQKCLPMIVQELKLPEQQKYTLRATFAPGNPGFPACADRRAQPVSFSTSDGWDQIFQSVERLVVCLQDA